MSHSLSSGPNAVAAARRQGNPDPRTYRRIHDLAEHAAARRGVDDVVEDLNSLPLPDREKIETRVEVIKRVPKWQERLINSKRLGGLVLPKYRENFTLIEYAYGIYPCNKTPARYFVQRALRGYVIPSPILVAPKERMGTSSKVMGRHQDLIVAADENASWAGGLYAYHNPIRVTDYEAAVGVGPDIDTLGLGKSCDKAIDAIAVAEPGNVLSRKIALLHDVTEKLLTLERVAEEVAPPAGISPTPI